MDLLRGLTVGFMILVNNAGSERDSYAPLQHAYWNGFTPTDLVFPTFLFLVGVTTELSLGARLDGGAERGTLFRRVLRRAALLYVLGVVVSSFPFLHLDRIRYVGVLPRIALCYLAVGTLRLMSGGWRDKVLVLAVALVGYWALLRFMPVPGFGVPTRDVPLLDRDGNLAAWLDRWMFAPQHLYERTRDPEGLLSTIPAIGTTLLGLLTGMSLRARRAFWTKTLGVAVAGVASVGLGLLWNVTLPINKKMWTSSYVLFAGGLSLLLLAAAMALIDGKHLRSRWFTPLLVFGTNAIAAYVLADVLEAGIYSVHVRPGVSVQRVIWTGLRGMVPNVALASLLYACGFVALCWTLIYLLYRRKIFLRI